MTIERDKWLYVRTTTPDKAREFFGFPPVSEVRRVSEFHFLQEHNSPLWAVRVPEQTESANEICTFWGHNKQNIGRK